MAQLESAAMGITANITGLPHVQGISNKTAIAADIADCKEIIEGKLKACSAQRNRIERYIANIDDNLMRQVVSYRFIDRMRWEQIAGKIGYQYKANALEQKLKRFLEMSAMSESNIIL